MKKFLPAIGVLVVAGALGALFPPFHIRSLKAVGGAQDSGVATLLRKAAEMMYQEKRRSGQQTVDGDSQAMTE